eukprot:scaffold9172_cov52-Phaeocystis_antarctica.AAC.4
MRHRGGAKCACRVDPSTSGGAAESTSSMYACNPPEGPSMCQRSPQNRLRQVPLPLHIIYPHSCGYLSHEAVASFMRQSPLS